MKISKGTYRIYIKLGRYGLKVPRINRNFKNPFLVFLTGIIMNALERKRYKRYVLGKEYGYKWTPDKYSLCPTYLSIFGLINIVRHADEVLISSKRPKASPFVEVKLDSFGLVNGKIVEIDYGDFTIYANKHTTVGEIDYK